MLRVLLLALALVAAVASLAAWSDAALAEKRVALVIGNSDYQHTTKLAHPRNDATDMSAAVLKRARDGVFPLDAMREYTHNYVMAGGGGSFSEYYTAKYDGALFSPSLTRTAVFSQHNLVTDRSFSEFNVIFCRNVLIYFDQNLQHRVHALFYQSLAMFGILALGSKESLRSSQYEACYQKVRPREKLYRKVK